MHANTIIYKYIYGNEITRQTLPDSMWRSSASQPGSSQPQSGEVLSWMVNLVPGLFDLPRRSAIFDAAHFANGDHAVGVPLLLLLLLLPPPTLPPNFRSPFSICIYIYMCSFKACFVFRDTDSNNGVLAVHIKCVYIFYMFKCFSKAFQHMSTLTCRR